MKRLLWIGFMVGALLGGCGQGTNLTADGALQERPGVLPPDRTALRVAQQNAPGGVSNETRLMLVVNELMERQKAPGLNWEVAVRPPGYAVTAHLTATQRTPVKFEWLVDFSQPPASVCVPLNEEARGLAKLRIRLDQEGLQEYLNGPTPQPSGRG